MKRKLKYKIASSKKSRKEWVKELDKLLTELVRARDRRCLRCGKDNIQAAHIYSKGKYTRMRYDPDNVIGLCWRCHMIWGHREPMEFAEWIKQKFPDKYQRLKMRSQIVEGGKIDYQAIKLDLLNEIKK